MREEDIPYFPKLETEMTLDKTTEPRPQKASYYYGTHSKGKGGGTPLARAVVSAHNACGKTGPGPPERVEDVRSST